MSNTGPRAVAQASSTLTSALLHRLGASNANAGNISETFTIIIFVLSRKMINKKHFVNHVCNGIRFPFREPNGWWDFLQPEIENEDERDMWEHVKVRRFSN